MSALLKVEKMAALAPERAISEIASCQGTTLIVPITAYFSPESASQAAEKLGSESANCPDEPSLIAARRTESRPAGRPQDSPARSALLWRGVLGSLPLKPEPALAGDTKLAMGVFEEPARCDARPLTSFMSRLSADDTAKAAPPTAGSSGSACRRCAPADSSRSAA